MGARMDILLAIQRVEERFLYEGDEIATEAWQYIRAFIVEALKPSHNKQSDAITLCKEMSVFHGPQALHEWFVANKSRINAVVA
jgi:hypothetical protein